MAGCKLCDGVHLESKPTCVTVDARMAVLERLHVGRDEVLEEAARVAEFEGGNENNYRRGTNAEDMARTIASSIRALKSKKETP